MLPSGISTRPSASTRWPSSSSAPGVRVASSYAFSPQTTPSSISSAVSERFERKSSGRLFANGSRLRSGCEAPSLSCARAGDRGPQLRAHVLKAELRPRRDDTASSHNTASRRPKTQGEGRDALANLPYIQQAQRFYTHSLYSRSEPRRMYVAHRWRPHLPQVLRGAVAQLLFAQGLKGYLRSRQ